MKCYATFIGSVIRSNLNPESNNVLRKKLNAPIYFNTNYRTEMKLVPIIMDYCVLQLDALEFVFGLR